MAPKSPASIPIGNCEVSVEGKSREGFQSTDFEHWARSIQGSGAKRVWEASLSSLKSKRVKGSVVDCQQGSNRDTCNSDALENKSSIRKVVATTGKCFKVMLTDFGDDTKKANLSKVIADLGGIVTCDGRSSTHVIADKVLETVDFCTALCSGAWIVSESWLQESSRQGKFLNEKPYILIDKEYELKYKLKLKTAISRAKACSGAFLKGYDVYFDRPDTPKAQRLSIIVRMAGAKIVDSFSEESCDLIYVADEKDVEQKLMEEEEAMNGLYMYNCNGDELLKCVMRQRFDLKPYENEYRRDKRLQWELHPELYNW